MRAAYDLAARADQEGRAERIQMIQSWQDDDEPGPATADRDGDGSPVWNALTQPLPLVDGRPFMTPAARHRADHAERRRPWE